MHEDVKVPHLVRVIGIDPSTTNMGVFVVDVNIAERTPFKLVYANTIYGDKVIYDVPEQYDDTASTSVDARSYCLARALGWLIEILKPDEELLKKFQAVTGICEDNFLGISALTFKQLIQFVAQLRSRFMEHNIHMSMVLPNPAKAVVGANFRGTQKEDVHNGLLAYDWLDTGDIDLSVVDEHTADAGAVTLYRCEQIAKHYGVSK